MAYIGKTPTVGNFQKCDAITVVNGQAAYTLQVGSANVSPESVNHMLVSLNGIIQSPTTAYTVSGATLTFASNLATGDVIDFVLLLGNVLDIGTPSDNTVATAKIQDDAVTLAKMAAGTDGNIISYDASGNPVAIATGTAGHFLKSQGAGAQPVFAAAGGGKIGQVVQAVKTDRQSITSTSYVDVTDMSASITPAATSSKVLVITSVVVNNHDFHAYWKVTDTSGGNLTDFRGDSGHGEQVGTMGHYSHNTNLIMNSTQIILHSPSTTSSTVYKVQMRVGTGTATVNFQATDTDSGTGTSSITLMEVLA